VEKSPVIPGFDFCFLSILPLQLRNGIGEKIHVAETAGNCAAKSKGFSLGKCAASTEVPFGLAGTKTRYSSAWPSLS